VLNDHKPTRPLAVGVAGHGGRLGRQVVAAIAARGWYACWRRDRQGVDARAMPAVLFDCSTVEGASQSLATARALGIPLVLATSGANWREDGEVREAAQHIPVVLATNLSRGHVLQLAIARLLAARPGGATRITVLDRHPVSKKDAPSATAKLLAEAVGTGCITAVREGKPVADHQVILEWPGEVLEITHRVTSLDAPVQGALAAIGAAAQLERPGLYDLESPELFQSPLIRSPA
jgi:4-hydroxy-tetrahydrodipicolinate reductase